MSIFGRKAAEAPVNTDAAGSGRIPGAATVAAVIAAPASAGASSSTTVPLGAPAYGIAEAIHLMRSLPVDLQNTQNAELVVRVVRTTLASLNVRVQDIIEDASRRQKALQESMAAAHRHIGEMEKALADKKREIATQEAELKETTSVKERLQSTERAATAGSLTPAQGVGVGGAANAAVSAPMPASGSAPVSTTAAPGLFSPVVPSASLPAPSVGPRTPVPKAAGRDEPGSGKVS